MFNWRHIYGRFFGEWGLTAKTIVTPDWSAVAHDWDGVHLSLAGVLTAEGVPITIDDNAETMLEGWMTEQTCWFRWAFSTPEPLPDWTGTIPA